MDKAELWERLEDIKQDCNCESEAAERDHSRSGKPTFIKSLVEWLLLVLVVIRPYYPKRV